MPALILFSASAGGFNVEKLFLGRNPLYFAGALCYNGL